MSRRKSTPQKPYKRKVNWLGKYPGRTLHRIGAALGGIWIATNLLNSLWPEPDQITTNSLLEREARKIKIPNSPASILLIEANEIKPESNQIKRSMEERKQFKSFTLINIKKGAIPEVIVIPIGLITKEDKDNNMNSIQRSFRKESINIISNLAFKVSGIPQQNPKRYIEGSTEILRLYYYIINESIKKNKFSLKTISIESDSSQFSTLNYSKGGIDSFKSKKELTRINLNEFPKESYFRSFEGNHKSKFNIHSFTKEMKKRVRTNLSYKELLSINSFFLRRLQ